MGKLQKRTQLREEGQVLPGASPVRHPLAQSVMHSPSIGLSLPSTRKTVLNPLDITSIDGTNLLSEDEKSICTNLRIFPRAYLSLKDIIMKEYAQKGSIKRKAVRSLLKIDVNKSGKLFDFFSEMGWINAK